MPIPTSSGCHGRVSTAWDAPKLLGQTLLQGSLPTCCDRHCFQGRAVLRADGKPGPSQSLSAAAESTADTHPHALQVLVYGRGLDVSTTARVQALGEVWCDTQVVQRPEPMPRMGHEAASPEARPSLLRRRQQPVQPSVAAANLVSHHLVAVAALLLLRLLLRPAQLLRTAQPMVLEVLVPGAVVRRLQLQQPEADATGLTVHLQSDFQSASLPVVFRQLQQQLSPTAVGLGHL